MLTAGQTMACTAHSCIAAEAKMRMSQTRASPLAPPRSCRPCCHLQEASEAAGECVYNVQHKLEAAGSDLRRDVAAALADAQEEVVARVRSTLSEAEGRHAARLEGATVVWCQAVAKAVPQLLLLLMGCRLILPHGLASSANTERCSKHRPRCASHVQEDFLQTCAG